jgi:NAD+ dependent glucose-6-phosphate dehydrogenase
MTPTTARIRRILITGAAGNLGCKLRRYLESKPGYELVLLDKRSIDDPAVTIADLSTFDRSWTDRFRGVDTVVHLAADASPWAAWSSLVPNNIDATINVFEAVAAHRVRRVVFASSVHAMLGYEREAVAPISVELATQPIDQYGVTKVFGERLGRNFADRHGLSVICLRLGWVPLINEPDVVRGNPTAQTRWLSDRDFCAYVMRAIDADNIHFAIVNAMSAIEGSNWDLTSGSRVLGYEPQDRFELPRVGVVRRLARRLRSGVIERARRMTQQ